MILDFPETGEIWSRTDIIGHHGVFHCFPEKRGYYGSRTVIVRVRRDFLVFNLQATFLLGFLLNFASGLLWQRSGHPIVLVGQESKLGSGESKMSNILTVACVQAVVHNFF